MLTSSAKAKGRRLAQKAKDALLKWCADLESDDIVVTSSGDTGPDLKLSPRAKSVYPLAIECKNQEKLNVFKSFKQAESHVSGDEKPVLIFSKNREDTYIALKLEDFLWLMR